MPLLKGEHIFLRSLEMEDLDFLYRLENDTSIWEISGTLTPYSKGVLRQYLKNVHKDIYEAKQLRMGICKMPGELVGLVDLFDFDPKNSRAGLGIIILEANDRNNGMGAEAVRLLVDYAFEILNLHQLYAHVLEDNTASMRLFEKLGFKKTGVKRDWVRSGPTFKNELLYQKISTK